MVQGCDKNASWVPLFRGIPPTVMRLKERPRSAGGGGLHLLSGLGKLRCWGTVGNGAWEQDVWMYVACPAATLKLKISRKKSKDE